MEKTTFLRQVIFDTVFVAENIKFVALVYALVPPTIPLVYLITILVVHLFGLLLKFIYYYFYHLWKDSSTLIRSRNSKIVISIPYYWFGNYGVFKKELKF